MEVSLQSFRKRFTYDPAKDLLGKGGFGEVYKAYDNEDHLFVALKISQGTADDKYNLIHEIKQFKKLNHPNIVKHIEAYEVNTGSTDIHGSPIVYHVGILEYADNGTLADLLKKGVPDYRIIEDLAKDIIEGLAYLHSENIIHRDLKPTNILLFSEGEKLRAKITDFGIAKRTDATAASTQLVGTVEYMAPEFFSTGNITPASDVWSVGVMLLEALTGTHPFGKTSQGMGNEQIIANILNKDLTTATQNLTEPLKKIITDCLRRESELRPQTAGALKAELANPAVDSFTEKTHVISIKQKSTVVGESKSRWKRWSKALFDFDLSNGRWRNVLAREFVINLSFIVLGILFSKLAIVIIVLFTRLMIHLQIALYRYNKDEVESSKREWIFFKNWKTYLIKFFLSTSLLFILLVLSKYHRYALQTFLWFLMPFLLINSIWLLFKVFLPQDKNKSTGRDPLWEQKKVKYKIIGFFVLNFLTFSSKYQQSSFSRWVEHGETQKFDFLEVLTVSVFASAIGLLIYWIYKKIEGLFLFVFGLGEINQ